ncbi:MAG: S24 family peptidase [Deltaproteobacteria bacterium]|nr:MAG: S24 family peptidase [Deltaproteobacteria bacterium]
MTGEGEMNSGHRERPDGAAIHGEFLNVPLYGHASGALPTGHWAINGGGEVQEYLAFERAFARSSFGTTANLVCLRATGDSMLPTISQGDLLVIDMSDCTVQKDAAPYILQIGETTAVKRLHRLTKNTIRIASDNPAGWSKEMTIQEMEAEGIEIKGRVVAIMKMA